MTVIVIFLLTITLPNLQADECGNRCTSSQACFPDGTCHERSNLVSCGFSFTSGSIHTSRYCKAGQDCCGSGCMPAGKVCCQTSYCETGHTCCSIIGCCPAGTFCSGFRCIDDKYSTMKPSTATPRPTSKPTTTSAPPTTKPRTTLQPITRYPTRTYPRTYPSTAESSSYSVTRYLSERTTKWPENKTRKSYSNDVESAFKPWHYVIIVIGVLFIIFVIVVYIRYYYTRKKTANAQALSGRRGIVLNAPSQIYGQENIHSGSNGTVSGVPTNTNRPPQQQLNVAYFVSKPATTTQTSGQQPNKRMLLVITKPNIHTKTNTKETSNSSKDKSAS